jgi:hypothetical protein
MTHPFVIVRMVPTGRRAVVVRAFALTPYDLELLATEVHQCGPGTRLEVTVGGDDADLTEVTAALAPIDPDAVEVLVSRAVPRTDRPIRGMRDRATWKENADVPSMPRGR